MALKRLIATKTGAYSFRIGGGIGEYGFIAVELGRQQNAKITKIIASVVRENDITTDYLCRLIVVSGKISTFESQFADGLTVTTLTTNEDVPTILVDVNFTSKTILNLDFLDLTSKDNTGLSVILFNVTDASIPPSVYDSVLRLSVFGSESSNYGDNKVKFE